MYSNVKYYCSSEIVQQTIDYGTAVRSSVSKRSGGSTVYNMPEAYHQPLASSVGQSCPSLVTDKGIWCPGYPVKYDDTSTYSPSISSGDHTSNEMPSKETMTSNPCSGSVCTFPSKNEKKVQKTARVVALRRMFVRRWDLIKKSTIRRSRNSSVTRKETKTSCKKSVYNEVGTEMDTMINAATFTSSSAKSRHFNLLRDTAAATSGLSVKKRKGLCVATSISDVKHLLPAPTVYHAGTQITRSPFSNKGPLTRRGVSFNGGSTEVTGQRSSSLRPKVDCTVMAGTNTPGQPPFRPTQLSRGVESRKSTLHNRPLFRPSKWADIVVNKIIKNIRSNSRKKLTTESRATTMTPVTTCSFSNDTRSMLSYFMPNDELGIISSKGSKCSRDCNTSNFCNMETDNYNVPFCPSDLAEKLAERIIIHITKKPTGYKLIGWPTDECCADVATECGIYQLGAQHPSHSSVRALKSESPRSSESLKLYKFTIPEEDTDFEKLQSEPPSTSDDMNKNTVVEKDTECHSSHSSEQGPKSASAELSENSNSSNHSTKLNITVLKNDSNLRRKPFRLPKQAFLSCFTGQPSEDSSIRSKSLPKLKLKSETDPDLINFQPIKLNLWPAYSEGSGIARCRTMLNTGLAEDDFFNIMEQLATQISCEVEKLKACSLRYSDLKRRYYGNKSSWQPTNPSNEFLITITEHEGNNEIVGRFKKETCQIDRNSQAEQVTFKITAMKPKYDMKIQEITTNIKNDRARELPAEVKPNDQTAKCKVCCGCAEKDEPTYETAEVNPTDQKVKVCCGCAEKDEPTYETAEVNPTDQKVKVCCGSAEKEKPTYETAEVKPTNQKPKGCCKCDEKPKEIVKEPPCQKIRDCTCAKHRAQELPADYKPINQKAKCKVCCGCAEKDKPTCETADVKPINQKPKVCCAEEDKPTCETADVKPDNQKAKCKVCCGCAEEDKPTCETADVKPNNQEVKGKVCCAEEDKPTCETADVKPNNQKSKCKAKQPTDDSQAPPTTQCPPTKDKTTEPDEAEKPRKLSCVRYISNLFSKKMKCMFEETPLEAFLKGLNADPGGRDDICCQTSRINEPRGPQASLKSHASLKSQASLKPPVQVNRVLVSLPEAITYKHLPNTISIWSTALCATHTRKESYSSSDSSQTLCVRVGQSRVNRVFSVTNICSGKEMEKLRLAYFLLTAMEGRVRRVNINRLFA